MRTIKQRFQLLNGQNKKIFRKINRQNLQPQVEKNLAYKQTNGTACK